MSSMPPYGEGNPYTPPTQYSQPGYSTPPAYNPEQGYMPPNPTPAPGYMPPNPAPGYMVQPQYMAVPVVPLSDPGSGQALVGMILGIAGLFLSFFGLVPLLGLIFSIIGMRSTTRKGMAIAGLILSIIGLIFAIIFTAIIITAFIAAANTPTY